MSGRRRPHPLREGKRRLRSIHQENRLSRFYWRRKRRLLRDYGVGFRSHLGRNLAYVVWDPEIDNFTYDLGNVEEVVEFLAQWLDADASDVDRYLREPDADDVFQSSIRAITRRRFSRKTRPRFGRRLGWYAVARLRRPELIVETGIHDGLGSALLLRALELNAREGGPDGRLISFDPRPETGWLVPASLRGRWEPRYETSQEGMAPALAGKRVDFFIHDSDHTYDVEHFEFDAILEYATPDAVLLSDNSHVTSALRDIADRLGRPYGFCPERPAAHWYPGAGMGLVVLSGGGARSRSTGRS